MKAGVPAGVVNMVCGRGATVGDALTRHPDVKLVSFTGSTVTGARIREAAAPFCKKLSLEVSYTDDCDFIARKKSFLFLFFSCFQLGGKNAALIFEDADLENCVQTTLRFEIALLPSTEFPSFASSLMIAILSGRVSPTRVKSASAQVEFTFTKTFMRSLSRN